MKLAALVLSYNHPELTERCVKSVLRHFDGPCYLVHNGSEKKIIERLKNNFPQIHHLMLDQNKGFSGGANFGLQQVLSEHDWCFFITNDCELTTPLLAPENSWSFVAPWIQLKKSGKTDSLGGKYFPINAKLKHNWSDKEFFENSKYNYIPGSAFYISKNIFFALNGFNEDFQTYWEDVEFSERCKRSHHNIQLLLDQKTILHHGIGKTCRKSTNYTLYLFYRNQIWMSQKYSPLPRLTLTLVYLRIISKAFELVWKRRSSDVKKLWEAARSPKPRWT